MFTVSVHEGQETEDELAESIARRRLNPPIAVYMIAKIVVLLALSVRVQQR